MKRSVWRSYAVKITSRIVRASSKEVLVVVLVEDWVVLVLEEDWVVGWDPD
jgi:hypothetical protein